MRRTKRRLPDSLTQHLSDPKIVAFRPRARQRNPYLLSGMSEKLVVSAVTLITIVLGGYLLRLW